MKTLKTLLSAFALVALTATSAMAQGQASITASANVVTDVTLTGVRGLDFGTLLDGDVDAGVTEALSTANEANLGKFQMTSLANGQAIVLSLSAPANLTPEGTPDLSGGTAQDDIPFTATATYTETDGDVDGGTDFSGGTASLTTGATTAYVYVGGTLNSGAAAGNYQGQYSGDVTLSVYYD